MSGPSSSHADDLPGRRCPACAAGGLSAAFTAPDLREGTGTSAVYLRCPGCGTLLLDGGPGAEAMSRAYQSGEIDPVGPLVRPPEPGPVRRLLRVLSLLTTGRKHSLPHGAGRGRSLLDVGCLGGDKLLDFSRRGFRVAGVDLNRAAIARARLLLPEGTFHEGPLETLPAGPGFDFIRCDNVLEHVPEPLPLLQQMRARLAPGGRLYLYVPSGESLSVRLLRGHSANVWVPWHLQLFSRAGLGQLLRRAGFAEAAVTPFTPLSWWELSARQLVAAPGAFRREPGPVEQAAILAARALTPAWIALGHTRLGEEWVVEAGSAEGG